jgi:hypothetical protein
MSVFRVQDASASSECVVITVYSPAAVEITPARDLEGILYPAQHLYSAVGSINLVYTSIESAIARYYRYDGYMTFGYICAILLQPWQSSLGCKSGTQFDVPVTIIVVRYTVTCSTASAERKTLQTCE